MVGPLLETKFHMPRARGALVARPRLSDRLSRGARSGVTLVSAPAGFGKSTLLTEWLGAAQSQGWSVAWLSLDERDNDPAMFWEYLVTAVQGAARGAGASALALLQPPAAPIDAALATLLNDLNALPNDLVLVLDDYHVIDDPEVQAGMAFLVEHLPPQVHLVIAGRADPALPLARLRGRGALVEIRAAELRFTPEEAAAYLNEVMGLALTAQDVEALDERTEGWIVALQLAALSMQGRDDVSGFIAGFAGDDRYIVDYLAEEVLQRQPDLVRSFLLQTSILSRLSGPLVDAVTGQAGGKAMLETLDRGNLFLVPLDDRRRWYRYHHLFADVLQARLLDEQAGIVPELHRRASHWYEQNGDRSEAVSHALAASDVDRAADLIELMLPALRRSRQVATLRAWLDALPAGLVRDRPVLSVACAGALLIRGQTEGVETHLSDAERWLDAHSPVTDAPEAATRATFDEYGSAVRSLPSTIAVYRAAVARTRDDVAGTMAQARRALELVGDDDHLMRGGAAGLLGLAYWTTGDLDAAYCWYADSKDSLEKAGHLSDVLGCALALADIRIEQGRLRDAMSIYEHAVSAATDQGTPVLRGVADMHVGMSELFRERNDLATALKHLRASADLGEHAGLPQNSYRSQVAMARVRRAEGDLGGALALLSKAQRLYVSDYFPDVRPIPALTARILVAQGSIGEALAWADDRGLSVEDDVSYLREYEHITLARALLARHTTMPATSPPDEVTRFLGRLLQAAEQGGRTGSVIELLVLLALAHQAGGDISGALTFLERALTLAGSQGYVRLFVDEGAPMLALLRAALDASTEPAHVRPLLAALDPTAAEPAGTEPAVPQGLVEPLSRRERDVLRLLATDLAGPAIARELFVSLNTVRSHTKSIYAKLGVTSRRSAVRRAVELDLLSRSRD